MRVGGIQTQKKRREAGEVRKTRKTQERTDSRRGMETDGGKAGNGDATLQPATMTTETSTSQAPRTLTAPLKGV